MSSADITLDKAFDLMVLGIERMLVDRFEEEFKKQAEAIYKPLAIRCAKDAVRQIQHADFLQDGDIRLLIQFGEKPKFEVDHKGMEA